MRTSAGPAPHADWPLDDPDLRPDLILVAGGLTIQTLADDAGLVARLVELAARSDEVGSICTGAARRCADHPEADLRVSALLERVRVDAACRMLERTDDGIGRIARRCGYGTVETFHGSFWRLTGVTPGEYRDRFRADPPAQS